ncbi:MAG: hypothetical protein WBX01_03720 [Nitrososphaeraceae archaeon]|jgi:hypothetical protein
MVSGKVKYGTLGIMVLFSGLVSVMTLSDPLFAQGSNQSAGNQTGEAMQSAGNQTVEALQTAGNRTGEGLQAAANETGEFLGNLSEGVQGFLNEGGRNQSG